MHYEVIFLDWYKTLSDSLFWEDWADDKEKKATLEAIQNYLFVVNPALSNDWMRGKYTAEEVVQQINIATGSAYSSVLAELERSSKNMKFKDENILHAVKQLQARGTKVLIATDNMDTFIRWTVPALGLDELFDGVLDSHTLRALKDDYSKNESRFFGPYLKTSPCEPSKMILIDDRKEAEVVRRTGMDFMHFDGTKSLSSILANLT